MLVSLPGVESTSKGTYEAPIGLVTADPAWHGFICNAKWPFDS